MGMNNNNRKDTTWIATLIEKRGADYIDSQLTSDEVIKNVDRIIMDIINCRINYNAYGEHFIKPVILDTLISHCSSHLAKLKTESFALGYVKNDYDNNVITHVGNVASDMLQSFYGHNRTPGTLTDSTANNISQLLARVNQDIMIYYPILNTLQTISITRNYYDMYALNNTLGQFVTNRKRINRF